MKEYVLVYAHYDIIYDCNEVEFFLIVKKHRPEWQKGLYNLIGGSIEGSETPEQAGIRELKEEAGIDADNAKILGVIRGDYFKVHCVSISVKAQEIKPRDGETELPEWTTYHKVKNDPLLINNLRVIIPLMHQGSEGWEIQDCYPNRNEFKVKVYAVRSLDCCEKVSTSWYQGIQ